MNRAAVTVQERGGPPSWAGRARPWSKLERLARRSPVVVIGAGLIAVVVLVALSASLIAPHNPVSQIAQPLLLPGGAYVAGTDELGRDELSRLIFGRGSRSTSASWPSRSRWPWARPQGSSPDSTADGSTTS